MERHETWVLDPKNAKIAGIPDNVYKHLLTLNPVTDVDEIRMAAIRLGLVRIRDYGNRVSVQFDYDRNHTRAVLWAVFQFVSLIVRGNTNLTIDNFRNKDSVELSLRDLGDKLREDSPIMKETMPEQSFGTL